MLDAQSEARAEPYATATDPPTLPRLSTVDPAAVLLAVERVGAEVSALGRAVAAQPEAVAARLDVDAAAASIAVRVGSLASALDQFRLSLLAALDRTADRLESPAWLPGLHAALAQSPAPDASRLDAMDVAAAAPAQRLARLEHSVSQLTDGIMASAAIADALDRLGGRLESIEDAACRVADDARLLVERVASVPNRLSAIASQVDRITPLARTGDAAESLFDRLDRVGAKVDETLALLRIRAGERDRTGGDARVDSMIDTLAGVTREQDQVTQAIASVLDQVRGLRGYDTVMERVEQRERSLAARLDRIDAELRRLGQSGTTPPETSASVETVAKHDGQIADGLAVVLERLEQQDRAMATQLEWVGDRLAEVAAHLLADEAADASAAIRLPAEMTTLTEGLARLVESTAAKLDQRIGLVESGLSQAIKSAAPAPPPRTGPSAKETLRRLAELRAERAGVQARLAEERLLATQALEDQF